MKKNVVIIVVAAVLIAALLLGGFPLFSRVVYHRSQAATMLAWQLEKETYTTEAAFKKYLTAKRAENALPYVLPPEASFTVTADGHTYEDMVYYVLNDRDEPDTLLFYFPGGSFTDQPRLVHWQFLDKLAADTGATVIVPIYPKLPAADASFVYDMLLGFYDDLMADTSCGRLLFMGDSAGGGMALSLAMQLRDAGMPGPDGLVLMSPWVDVTMTNPEIPDYEKKDPALDAAMLSRLGQLWAGDLDGTDPIVSPLYGELDGLGEITLLYSESEILCPDLRLFSQALDSAGTVHTDFVERGMFHVWPLYVAYDIPEVQKAYEAIAAAVTE